MRTADHGLVQSSFRLDVTTVVDLRGRPVDAIDQLVNIGNIALLRPIERLVSPPQCNGRFRF